MLLLKMRECLADCMHIVCCMHMRIQYIKAGRLYANTSTVQYVYSLQSNTLFVYTCTITFSKKQSLCKRHRSTCSSYQHYLLKLSILPHPLTLNHLITQQFLAEVGPVTSSVMNTAKRVIVIIACAIIFGEKMDRNAKLGAAIAVGGQSLQSPFLSQST